METESGSNKNSPVLGTGLHGDGIPCNYDRTESVFGHFNQSPRRPGEVAEYENPDCGAAKN